VCPQREKTGRGLSEPAKLHRAREWALNPGPGSSFRDVVRARGRGWEAWVEDNKYALVRSQLPSGGLSILSSPQFFSYDRVLKSLEPVLPLAHDIDQDNCYRGRLEADSRFIAGWGIVVGLH